MLSTTKKPSVNRKRADRMAALATSGKFDLLGNELIEIELAGNTGKRGTWAYFASRFRYWINSELTEPVPFSIFSPSGNKKLPFFAFSSLPAWDCPGAGPCLDWCYSFRSWRYPGAFFRQLQNSLLLRFSKDLIARAWEKIPNKSIVRLYVDGDFFDLAILVFWMELIKARPSLKVYGYSKSWELFLQLDKKGFAWPTNYFLNLSSGSKYESD